MLPEQHGRLGAIAVVAQLEWFDQYHGEIWFFEICVRISKRVGPQALTAVNLSVDPGRCSGSANLPFAMAVIILFLWCLSRTNRTYCSCSLLPGAQCSSGADPEVALPESLCQSNKLYCTIALVPFSRSGPSETAYPRPFYVAIVSSLGCGQNLVAFPASAVHVFVGQCP